MSEKIKFVKNKNHVDNLDMMYNPEKKIYTFYQFCKHKNPETNMFGSRKIFFDELGNILKVYEKEFNKRDVQKYIQYTKTNKYKIYSTIDISCVNLPSTGDLQESQSLLL